MHAAGLYALVAILSLVSSAFVCHPDQPLPADDGTNTATLDALLDELTSFCSSLETEKLDPSGHTASLSNTKHNLLFTVDQTVATVHLDEHGCTDALTAVIDQCVVKQKVLGSYRTDGGLNFKIASLETVAADELQARANPKKPKPVAAPPKIPKPAPVAPRPK